MFRGKICNIAIFKDFYKNHEAQHAKNTSENRFLVPLRFTKKNSSIFGSSSPLILILLSLGSCGNFDFEKGTLEGWERGDRAFDFQPTYGDNVRARTGGNHSSGHQGSWWIGSYENRPHVSSAPGGTQGNGPVGWLRSPFIRITGAFLNFLIGGGCDTSKVRLELLVDNYVVLYTTGNCKDEMIRKTFNVGAFKGRVAQLRLLDFASGGWGHINFDDLGGDYDCMGTPWR